jgi:hypothetical protein
VIAGFGAGKRHIMPVFPVLTIFPMTATVIAGAFAAILLNRYISSRRRPHELMWGIAFLLFAFAAGCQVYADVKGDWTPLLARIYYLTGAILNVGFLGLGTLYLVASRRVANVGLVVMLLITAFSAFLVFRAPIDMATLATEAGWKSVTEYSPWPRVLAVVVNSIGTVLVVGGALWSAWVFWRKRVMKGRMVGVLLLAVGTFLIALGGTITGVTGLKNHDYLYITMAAGSILMFVGYLQTIRPEASLAQAPVPTEQKTRA